MSDSQASDVLYRGRVFTLERKQVTLPNGKTMHRELVRHPGAVVILPVTAEGRVLLIEQYRPAIERSIFELAAGTLEPGESPLECAKREIQEEIGVKAGRWTDLGTLYPAPGFCNELQHLYIARDLEPCTGCMDEDEVIRPLERSVAEIEAMIAEGSLLDAKSIATFARARLRALL